MSIKKLALTKDESIKPVVPPHLNPALLHSSAHSVEKQPLPIDNGEDLRSVYHWRSQVGSTWFHRPTCTLSARCLIAPTYTDPGQCVHAILFFAPRIHHSVGCVKCCRKMAGLFRDRRDVWLMHLHSFTVSWDLAFLIGITFSSVTVLRMSSGMYFCHKLGVVSRKRVYESRHLSIRIRECRQK